MSPEELPPAAVGLRLLMALVLGGLIGWNRERHDKPAGLRTHMLVALGSATFVLLGLEVANRSGDPIDPTRVLQGVVGGIGFLGAGSIIKAAGQVKGITTAASVWVSGALGAAAGMGAYVVATSASLLALLTLVLVEKIAPKVRRRTERDRGA